MILTLVWNGAQVFLVLQDRLAVMDFALQVLPVALTATGEICLIFLEQLLINMGEQNLIIAQHLEIIFMNISVLQLAVIILIFILVARDAAMVHV